MENVCAVPGELVDHITRGKEPWSSALSLDRKLGTLLQKHLRHHLIGGESVEAGVQPQRREKKHLEGSPQISLKSLLRTLAQPRGQCVITKPLPPWPNPEKLATFNLPSRISQKRVGSGPYLVQSTCGTSRI